MNPASNLILIGPMGAGKSSVGRVLARRFGLRFVDSDQAIIRQCGVDIATIFDYEGEAGFRRRERDVLARLLQNDDLLLATGGGAVLDADNRALMARRGHIVHLHVEVEQQLARLAHDRSRPLLARDDREAVLHALAAARTPLYRALADVSVDTSQRPSASVVAVVAEYLAAHWQRAPAPPAVSESDRT